MSKFIDFELIGPLQQALEKVGYETPTPIQQQAIPLVLQGHDLLAIAQTGTGKTAAFCLPALNHLHLSDVRREAKRPRALVLTPTRELAIQIHDNLKSYGFFLPLKYAVVFGGVSQGKQVQSLRHGTDVLVATPGRLLDLINQKLLILDAVEIFVLDEADRMLDMGFMNDIKKVLKLLPKKRQNLFFSATMPAEIQILASNILVNPKKVEVTPPATTVDLIHQTVMYVDKNDKTNLLVQLLKDESYKKTLIFVGMKHVANRVAQSLEKNNITAKAIHGNKSQGARQKAIQEFAAGEARVLVATDIASRGIDIDGITHVINYDLSNIAESYVHRIGRTARAGSEGKAVSFVTADEKSYLVNIERTTKQKIEVVTDQPYHSETAANASIQSVGKAKAKIEGQARKGRPSRSRGGSKRPARSSRATNAPRARRTSRTKQT